MGIKEQIKTIAMGLCHSAASIWLMVVCQTAANWFKAMGLFALFVMCSCTSPLGHLDRMFPDGASVKMKGLDITVSALGSGNAKFDEVSWVGTNGFPLPGTTNTPNTVTLPKGTTFQVK